MSDDALEIRSGGVIAVDTASLRDAAGQLSLVAGECEALRARLVEVTLALADDDGWRYVPTGQARAAEDAAAALAADLRTMAEAYDIVELWAEIGIAHAGGDSDRVGALTAVAMALMAQHPAAAARACGDVSQWSAGRRSGMFGQLHPGPPQWYDALSFGMNAKTAAALAAGTALGLAGLLIDAAGRGAPSGAALTGPARPVTLTTVSRERAHPPTGLRDVASRIPHGDGRVRVEKYTLADGQTSFVAYVAGTQIGVDADEPWDMASNYDLYTGTRSVSYDATMAALAAAGAQPGDTVLLAGHSQGAMIASHVATSGLYEVPALVTLGDPVQVDVGESTLNVDIRHGDDPVAALAAGGHVGRVGSSDSIVAERTSSATIAEGEALMDPHALTRYTETAALLDASTDPRMGPVREVLLQLETAVSVEATVYGATRRPAAR